MGDGGPGARGPRPWDLWYSCDVAAPILVISGPAGAGKSTVAALRARRWTRTAHIRIDDVMAFVADPAQWASLPESGHRDLVVGGAAAVMAMHFAEHDYHVVLDGHVFPEGLAGLAAACLRRGIPLHYAVLRVDASTSLARIFDRDPAATVGPEAIDRLCHRYDGLGTREANVIDASVPSGEVEAGVLSAFESGRLLEVDLVGGVEQRPITLIEHDPAWTTRFLAEARRIRDALGHDVRVEHIGSTAVPGLIAKPIVDIQVSVDDVGDEASYVPALQAAGYALRVREHGHRMLRTPTRDVHVHVCDHGSDWEQRHLAFRDRLRGSADARDRYANVKRSLASSAWPTMNDYAAAKSDVIAEILAAAT